MTTKTFSILAAVDESDQAPLVIERALDEAARHEHADVHFLRAMDVKHKLVDRVSTDGTREALAHEVLGTAEAFVKGATKIGWRVHVHVRVGRPDEEIIALAHEARPDLIVIGRHGDSGRKKSKAGNVVEKVLREAPCLVLVVQDRCYDEIEFEQCPACVKARHDSDGEVWFCAEHHDELPVHSVIGNISGSPLLHGFGNSGLY